MEFKTYTVLTLLVCSSPAFAWQPLTYPIRSQSAYERSVDTALCYAAANKTKVNITREPQVPPRKAPPTKASSTGVPSRPPLPSSTFASAPMSASMPAAAATGRGASAPAATAAAAGASSVKSASAPTAGSEAMAATGASSTNAELGAPGTAASSSQANAASAVKLPPLPEPEPPMARYWAAYAECMQGRGYVVVQ